MFAYLWTVRPAAGTDSVADPDTGEVDESGAAAAAALAAAAVSPRKGSVQDSWKGGQAFSKGDYLRQKSEIIILLHAAGNYRGFCSLKFFQTFVLKVQALSLIWWATRLGTQSQEDNSLEELLQYMSEAFRLTFLTSSYFFNK